MGEWFIKFMLFDNDTIFFFVFMIFRNNIFLLNVCFITNITEPQQSILLPRKCSLKILI